MLLSTHTEIDDVVQLFSATASRVGYLLKDSVSDLDELIGALTRINEGGTVLDPKLVVELLRARRADPLDALTPREREVVGLMAEGQSNAGIAKTLWITHGAVEKHIKHIFTKLGIPATSTPTGASSPPSPSSNPASPYACRLRNPRPAGPELPGPPPITVGLLDRVRAARSPAHCRAAAAWCQ